VIVDAHAHIFREMQGHTATGPTRSLPFGKVQCGDGSVIRLLPPLSPGPAAFPPESLLQHMDWAGVDKAVLLQAPFYGDVNEYVHDAVTRWPDRFIGSGQVDPRAANARETFRRITDDFGFRILKFEMSPGTGLLGLYPDLTLDDDSMAWLWEEADRGRMAIALDLGDAASPSYQTGQLARILEQYRNVKIVIAHLARPPMDKEDDSRLDALWREQILLARHPNVWLDLSALPERHHSETYPFPSACRYVLRAAEMVGPQKLLWGSDAPGLLLRATYPQLLSFVAEARSSFPAEDLRRILGGNAVHAYG